MFDTDNVPKATVEWLIFYMTIITSIQIIYHTSRCNKCTALLHAHLGVRHLNAVGLTFSESCLPFTLINPSINLKILTVVIIIKITQLALLHHSQNSTYLITQIFKTVIIIITTHLHPKLITLTAIVKLIRVLVLIIHNMLNRILLLIVIVIIILAKQTSKLFHPRMFH